MNSTGQARHTTRTVLLIGEGDAEVLFIRHFKSLYVHRYAGVSVTIKNARGMGAAHVVDFAYRQSRNTAYDEKAALLDTDAGWNDKTRAAAKQAKVQILASTPCFEALLLEIHRIPVQGRTSSQLKHDFLNRFREQACSSSVLKHFDQLLLNEARTRLPVLDHLLHLLSSGKAPLR
jgi:hypothetical protein